MRVNGQLGRRCLSFAVLVLCLCTLGCLSQARHVLGPPSPTAAQISQVNVSDVTADSENALLLNANSLFVAGEKIRREHRPTKLPPKRAILALSGGGSYGAFSAGILVGWSKSGLRPEFDVVTGISTGALIAPLAFLGSAYDSQIEELYTNVTDRDLFRIRKSLNVVFGESLADNSPLVTRLEQTVTPELLRAIAIEHAKGRRLYVGTTELDSRRCVIWDLGAIATRGTEQDLVLFRQILQASAAIPGFFPPVRIPVTINGTEYEERHVDGGVTASVVFRPPYIDPSQRNDPDAASLYDSDLFILVAGKTFPEEDPVRPRSIRIVTAAVSTLLYTSARGDLNSMYMASVLTGMNYHLAAIPQDYPVENSSTEFIPAEMQKLYREGMKRILDGTAFRRSPPGLEQGEGVSLRAGTDLFFDGTKRPLAPLPAVRPLMDVRPLQRPLVQPVFERNGDN